MTEAESPHEPSERPSIRSYVIRSGRLTSSQQSALRELWPKYGIDDIQSVIDPETVFGRSAPLVLEIGFGMGTSLAEMAARAPENDFIGVEVHRPGVGRLLHEIEARKLHNLRVYCHDGREVLRRCIADEGLSAVQIFFPDPWHKKRHNKRRLIQPPFVELIRQKLGKDGKLHLATDWEPYAKHMMEVLSTTQWRNAAGTGRFSAHTGRPETRFESRGRRLGHEVWDLVFFKE